jgi:hypothetical protein
MDFHELDRLGPTGVISYNFLMTSGRRCRKGPAPKAAAAPQAGKSKKSMSILAILVMWCIVYEKKP